MAKKPVVNLARLEELMWEKKWGLGELAAYSGVKYDTVYSLAKGRRPNSNIATLKRIADALDVSVDYLLGESNDKSPPAQALPRPLRHLVKVAADLPSMRQEELVRIAAALVELERERAQRTVSVEAMRAVLEASETFKGRVPSEDLLVALQLLIRDLPARWLIDLQPAQEPANEPPQGK